ncbi:MAG: DUF87 domain-containing protein [Pseudomonadota bacterium]
MKVELDPERKSPVRADLDGATTIISINSYLTFELGAGESALGIITDLESRESFDPTSDDLTLELVRPRRIATLQLLGTIRSRDDERTTFDPGITVLPTLDTPAVPAEKEHLDAVFASAPKRNRPSDHEGDNFDSGLHLGTPAGAPGQKALGSFNDLFSRPVAVVGNTGSGKSCTIAHLIQKATEAHNINSPRFFVLDINGEYASAFQKPDIVREPNSIYVNGESFGVPLWLMNASEVCQWLSAAEQVQEPVLKNLWSFAKGSTDDDSHGLSDIREAIIRLERLCEVIRGPGTYKGQNAFGAWNAFKSFAGDLSDQSEGKALVDSLQSYMDNRNGEHEAFGSVEKNIIDDAQKLKDYMTEQLVDEDVTIQESADKPIYFPVERLHDPSALLSAGQTEQNDAGLIQNLRGLELRLRNRLNDKRWTALRNYKDIDVDSFNSWLGKLGIGVDKADDVCVIDCSMLSYEVLPYACGIIGRVLLELREHVDAGDRFHEPWVLVLEEAHNYVRPRRQTEDRGIAVSREAFERIAKEGRKFGLSLIVASQRPSEISSTVLSQCANFVMHRLQNPDDIEHFRSIVPSQSRRLMDQVSILAPGEAVVVGSAFHIPARVQVHKPDPEPSSKSSTPHTAWGPENTDRFDLGKALANWGVDDVSKDNDGPAEAAVPVGTEGADDDIPF